MGNEEIKSTLDAVCNTLNHISVEGVSNMERMVGAYYAIKQLCGKINTDNDVEKNA